MWQVQVRQVPQAQEHVGPQGADLVLTQHEEAQVKEVLRTRRARVCSSVLQPDEPDVVVFTIVTLKLVIFYRVPYQTY